MINGEWVSSSKLKIHKKFINSPIGIIPANSYSGDRHSKESLEWLAVLEKQWSQQGKVIQIHHARSTEGEKIATCKGKLKAIKYKLDGYFEYDAQKYACEYNGCNWHGCPECFPSDRENTMKGSKSLAQRYRDTLVKEKRLREIGYEVITKWSCTFQTDLIQNKDMRDFVKSLKIKEPYFGIMKVTFIPPHDLIHPILPIRCNGKLKFPLCFKCASLENDKECTCPISERSFIYTYCTPEIEVAINMGYIIEEVHEVLHWPQTEMYDLCLKKRRAIHRLH